MLYFRGIYNGYKVLDSCNNSDKCCISEGYIMVTKYLIVATTVTTTDTLWRGNNSKKGSDFIFDLTLSTNNAFILS